MVTLNDVMQSRSQPRILILNQDNELVYISAEAQKFLSSLNGNVPVRGTGDDIVIPETLYRACRLLKKKNPENSGDHSGVTLSFSHESRSYLVRAVPLCNTCGSTTSTLKMVIVNEYKLDREKNRQEIQEEFKLSDRECEVVEEILKGMTNTEIARELYISPHTVKDHIKSVMEKLGVNKRTMVISKFLG